jgi:tripartite ATP-independent transporter DctM subunit
MLALLGSFLLLLIIKMPIGFCLFVSSLFFMITNGISPNLAIQRIAAGIDNFTLLAVPGFILAGAVMNNGGITQRIFWFARKLVGHFTGGLAHSNILASVIFAGMSGSAVADAGGLGAIELKAMKDAGFDEDFSLAVTGASSIVGPIIPPSIPAVIYGVTAGVSIGRLFAGGFIPGLLLAGALSTLVYVQSKKRGYPKDNPATLPELWQAFKHAFFPLLTPVLIIGGILGGICTPTEASIMAVAYAVLLSFIYKSITIFDLFHMLKSTFETTLTVLFIISSANLFGYVLTVAQVPQQAAALFVSIFTSKWIALFAVNLFFILVGCFMESTAAIMILVPIFLPAMSALGVDPVHLGIILILNLMIGLTTPPVGMVLYVLSTVSKVPFEKIAKAIFPYVIVSFLVTFIITYAEPLVLFLPNLFYS